MLLSALGRQQAVPELGLHPDQRRVLRADEHRDRLLEPHLPLRRRGRRLLLLRLPVHPHRLVHPPLQGQQHFHF